VTRARQLIDAYEESTARGDGRITIAGAVIDTPVVLRARRLLERYSQVDAFEARKQTAMSAAGAPLDR
jgi:citrate lyase beta subunit